MPTIRAFAALTVPVGVVQAVAAAQARCVDICRAVRWVAPEKVHLTLKFLGDIDAAAVAAVAHALAEAAAAEAPLTLSAAGMGVFPGIKNPRVLWMGIAGQTARLIAFAGRIDARLAALGFTAERRPYRAHLTLGRFKARVDPGRLAGLLASAAPEPVPFTADRVVLFRSELLPSGAQYTPLATHPLAATDASVP